MAKKKDTEKKVTPMHFCIEEKDVEKQLKYAFDRKKVLTYLKKFGRA